LRDGLSDLLDGRPTSAWAANNVYANRYTRELLFCRRHNLRLRARIGQLLTRLRGLMELFAMSVLQTPSYCRAIPFCVLLLLLLDDLRIGQALCHD
jgi:hypothetical protein